MKLFFSMTILTFLFSGCPDFGALIPPAILNSGVTAPVVADIKASRTSCVSPCTVMFSAENTTSDGLTPEEVYANLGYHFDFDDPDSGTFATTGLSKTSQIGGPLATHTFKCASGQCTYNVGLRAQNTVDEYDDAFVQITVDSATHRFSAANTVCVSTNGNYSGDAPCPAGATQLTSVPDVGDYSGKRILLRKGETFGKICIAYSESDVLIEPFGNNTDARPIIPAGSGIEIGVNNKCGSRNVSTSQALALGSEWAKNISVTGIRVGSIKLGMSYTDVDLHDLDMNYETETSGGIASLSGNTGRCYNSSKLDCAAVPYPKGAYISETVVIGSSTNPPGFNIGAFDCPMINWLGVIGNTTRSVYEHNYRSQGQWRGNWSHNHMLGGHTHTGGKSKLTIRGCGISNVDPTAKFRSETNWTNIDPLGQGPVSKYGVVADNTLGHEDSDNNAWKGQSNPQNSNANEGLELYVWERNTFVDGIPDPSNDLSLAGRHLTARTNNVYSSGAANCLDTSTTHTALSPSAANPTLFKTVANCAGPVPPTPNAPLR